MRTVGAKRLGRTGPAAALLALLAGAAGAEEPALLHVLPGQSAGADQAGWRAPCETFVLTAEVGRENYLGCERGDGAVTTANLTAEGVVWWVRFWGAGGLDRDALVARLRAELGVQGGGVTCLEEGEAAECWPLGAATLRVPLAQLSGQWTVVAEDPALRPPG